MSVFRVFWSDGWVTATRPLTVGQPTSGRDFFSTHFDINYLPENQARTEALWETSENGGRAAYDDGRRVTFVARFCWSRGECVFKRGAGRNPNPTLSRCRGPDFVNERDRGFSPQ